MSSGDRRGPAPTAPSRSLREDDPWLLQRIVESIASGLVVLDGDGSVPCRPTKAGHGLGNGGDRLARAGPVLQGIGTA